MKERTERILQIIILSLVVLLLIFVLRQISDNEPPTVSINEQPAAQEPEKQSNEGSEPEEIPEEQPQVTYPVTYTLEQAAELTVVVNKKHKLPQEFVPTLTAVNGGQLRPEAASALTQLLNDASTAGVPMKIISSYRSYNTQVTTYNKWVNLQGKTQADRSSARPGHSEHQTGLAVDLGVPDGTCDLLICFGDTAQGKWLASNVQNYGFIIRYEPTTESVTGYQYEPWHLRYVGVEQAQSIVASGLTMDEFYGVEAGSYVE